MLVGDRDKPGCQFDQFVFLMTHSCCRRVWRDELRHDYESSARVVPRRHGPIHYVEYGDIDSHAIVWKGHERLRLTEIRKIPNETVEIYQAKPSKNTEHAYFNNNLDTFGHVFENLVLRGLNAYAQASGARVMQYRDDTGLEADAVFQMPDGRYALIEMERGAGAIPAAERVLLKFDELILRHNEKAMGDAAHPGVLYRRPDLMQVICATAPFAYTTESGVTEVPVGCLKDWPRRTG